MFDWHYAVKETPVDNSVVVVECDDNANIYYIIVNYHCNDYDKKHQEFKGEFPLSYIRWFYVVKGEMNND